MITHHFASYATVAFLGIWSATSFTWRGKSRGWRALASLTGISLIVCVAWAALVAESVKGYLLNPLKAVIQQLADVINGQQAAKHFFAHQGTSFLEKATGFGGVIVILLMLPIGLWLLWHRRPLSALGLVLCAVALVYPASLGLRLTQQGTEASLRSSEYIFLGIAVVLAAAATRLYPSKVARKRLYVYRFASTSIVLLLFASGIVLGMPANARLPGPFEVAAEQRSVSPQGVAAAHWASNNLAPGRALLSDRTTRQLMGSYGDQNPARGDSVVPHLDPSNVFFSPRIDATVRQILRDNAIQYVVVDQRLSSDVPFDGYYFDLSETQLKNWRVPIPPAALDKFDDVPGIDRVYDNGALVIYDVGTFRSVALPDRAR